MLPCLNFTIVYFKLTLTFKNEISTGIRFMSKNLELKDKERELEMAPNKCLIEIEGYYNLEQSIESLKETIKNQILKPKHIVPFFQQGRLFKVKLK